MFQTFRRAALVGLLICFVAGCAEFQDMIAGGKAGATETAIAALDVTEAAIESGKDISRIAAETSDSPWGILSGWGMHILFTAAAAGCLYLKRRLLGSQDALTIVAGKIDPGPTDPENLLAAKKDIRLSVKTKMDGESAGVKAALAAVLK